VRVDSHTLQSFDDGLSIGAVKGPPIGVQKGL